MDGRTLVPLSAIFEALGGEVSWNESSQTVTGTKGNITLEMQIDNKVAKVNGKEITLDVPAQIIDDRTMVQLRFIAEKDILDSFRNFKGEDKLRLLGFISSYIANANSSLNSFIRTQRAV